MGVLADQTEAGTVHPFAQGGRSPATPAFIRLLSRIDRHSEVRRWRAALLPPPCRDSVPDANGWRAVVPRSNSHTPVGSGCKPNGRFAEGSARTQDRDDKPSRKGEEVSARCRAAHPSTA